MAGERSFSRHGGEVTMATLSLGPDVGITRKDRMGYWRDHQGKSLLVTPLVSEEMLAVAFLRFKAEGLLDRIFSEQQASLSWFIKHYSRDEISMLACLKEDLATKQMSPCGLAWIVNRTSVGNPPVFYKAECGEAFFRHTSPRETLEFGQMVVDWAFENCRILSLYGTTPEPNHVAVKYARRLGFNVHGPFPNYTAWVDESGQRGPCGAYISVMSRDQWHERAWR